MFVACFVMFYFCVISTFAVILMGKKELIALL